MPLFFEMAVVGWFRTSEKETLDLTMCRWNFSPVVPSGDILILIIVFGSQVVQRCRGQRSPLSPSWKSQGEWSWRTWHRDPLTYLALYLGSHLMGGKGSRGAWGYKGLESDWVGSNPGSATSSWATLGTLTCQNSIFPVENESNAYLIGCLGGLNGKMYPEHLILCLAYRQGLPKYLHNSSCDDFLLRNGHHQWVPLKQWFKMVGGFAHLGTFGLACNPIWLLQLRMREWRPGRPQNILQCTMPPPSSQERVIHPQTAKGWGWETLVPNVKLQGWDRESELGAVK